MRPERVYHRIQHDVAYAWAAALLDIIEPCLREEERRDAFLEFYEAMLAALESYELHIQQEGRRLFPLRPGRN